MENEVQLFLTERLDGLQSKMDQLVNQLEEEKLLRVHLQSQNVELEKKIYQLTTENAKQNEIFEAKIELLMAQNVQQDKEIYQLNFKINKEADDTKRAIIKHEEADDSSPRLPPSSCRQLSTIGHYLDGIYLVANPETNKIESVYCDFASSTLSETLYGSVDVKTTSIHFFVQRNSNFDSVSAVVPFEIQHLNEGDAMNLATGVFTVPVNGIYHFEFKGIKLSNPTELRILLQVNGVDIGEAYATNLANYLALSGISASLRLKIGDQVRLYKLGGTIHDSAAHYTFFTGWLLEEDLMLTA